MEPPEVLMQYAPSVRRLCWKLLPDAAEDLCQEVYCRALTAWPPARLEDLRGWLCTIARHTAINWIRHRQMTQRLEGQVGISQGARMTHPPLTLSSDMSTALAALPAEQREVIVALHCEGYTTQEIAQQWRIPRATVSTRVFRGMQTLRQRYQAERPVHHA